ncbi:TRAP transporter large permease [Halodesulfovibrio marinisediminis]|uniref:C4-dicarboxylate transporter, DctM subunit n=1 Tax=Halodesulfovibrio marinisediminis DSM 17456 TaxID=1121457 RepID=A0A1N6FN51_9BACT|nr:TRAP transporter large permease subunit [Halodesulfovibrio marinisediminis]SIN96620.1 C4-dicarboxylate transporter, DctM subunit [Halodesulfovibrio marinisediminis DSM 17456]
MTTISQTAENKSWLAWLDENFEKPFLFTGMLSIILIITFQTFYRYIGAYFSSDASAAIWTEELARFIFIWISYLAIPVAIKNRNNIRVDIVYDRLPARLQRMSWIVVDLCFLILVAVVFYMGLNHLEMLLEFPQVAPATNMSYFIPYLILPVGFALMGVRLLQDMYKQAKECGLLDTFIGFAFTAIIAAPVLISEDLNTLPVLFGYFLLFLVIGVPISIGLGLAATATIYATGTLPIEYVAQITFTSIDSFPIMAIPFFIAAGVFMGAGGLSKRLLNLADEMLGSLHGGMALATIATCMFFAAISGSGPATVAAIGSLTIPAMVERGYDKLFAAAIVAASGAIGVMIPPSNPFVVYGVSAQVSIGKLFMGGIVPGVLTGLALMVYAYIYSKKRGWKGEARERNASTFMRAFWDAKWALMVPVIILGGIYGGIMTPTEAAALAAFYGLVVGVFVYRELNLSNLVPSFMEACSTSAIVIVLMAMATIFGNIMTIEQVPTTIANAMMSLTSNKLMILFLINILLLIVGTFMEALAAIVILTPILLPIVMKVGVDPVHFGIVMVVNLAVGFVTPPVGVNLFVASGVANAKIEKLSKVAMPLVGLMIAVLLLITYIPAIPLLFVN